jgi:hypothetical protein
MSYRMLFMLKWQLPGAGDDEHGKQDKPCLTSLSCQIPFPADGELVES